jgi:hypothetical protein
MAGETKAGIKRALYRIGAEVRRTAIQNAPISPTEAVRKSLLKPRSVKRGTGGRFLSRKRRTRKVGATPGGLAKSIVFVSDADSAEIFVASNSEAGKYAERMHDGKGVSWWKRGPGTVKKGAQADAKFIKRAIATEEPFMLRVIDAEMEKVRTTR